MNTILTTPVTSEPARHQHPPSPPAHPPRRVGPLDRAALHLGVALITWSRRPLEIESRERLVRQHELRRAGLKREREYERTLLLGAPPR